MTNPTSVPTPYPYADQPDFPKEPSANQPKGIPAHACMGLNSCKGADRFGLDGHPADASNPAGPKVQNECAGQGYCSTTADHQCHVQNECKGQGGCGLYGTAKEMNDPGNNACRSQGSCATPINAERFSTNGPNQGKSVWLRARAVFEATWADKQKELVMEQANGNVSKDQPLPATLLSAPLSDGPSYLWVSEDDKERGNMTACGASGMSGAGGCS